MTAQEASDQAALAGDDQTSLEGQTAAGVLSVGEVTKPAEATEHAGESKPVVPEKLEPKDKRKSDKEWQEAQEKAKKAEEYEDRLTKQDREISRLRFERDNPIALDYTEELDKLDKDPRWKEITWEERLSFVRKEEPSKVRQDMKDQAAASQGSISAPSETQKVNEGISPSLLKEGESWFGSEEKARKAYEKYGVR